jgi:hypothetical protein
MREPCRGKGSIEGLTHFVVTRENRTQEMQDFKMLVV